MPAHHVLVTATIFAASNAKKGKKAAASIPGAPGAIPCAVPETVPPDAEAWKSCKKAIAFEKKVAEAKKLQELGDPAAGRPSPQKCGEWQNHLALIQESLVNLRRLLKKKFDDIPKPAVDGAKKPKEEQPASAKAASVFGLGATPTANALATAGLAAAARWSWDVDERWLVLRDGTGERNESEDSGCDEVEGDDCACRCRPTSDHGAVSHLSDRRRNVVTGFL